jgi:serine/threonine protein phosphatase 1
MKRHLITTDIHGMFDELTQLLDLVKYDSANDVLVNLGDSIHRGPKSAECIQFLRNYANIALMGNHEEKELKIRKARRQGVAQSDWKFTWNEHHLETDLTLSDEDVSWMENLPYYHELTVDDKKWVLCHAGLLPWRQLEDTKKSVFSHLRYVDKNGKATRIEQNRDAVHWASVWNGPYNVIYGHHVGSEEYPVISTRNGYTTIGLDTGACFGGKLSMLIMPTMEIVQVPGFKYRELH